MNKEKREIEPAGNNPPPKSSNTSAGLATPLPRNEDSHPQDLGPKELARTTISPSPVAMKATGPRTLDGKERSKYNALKHGVFSSVVVLKGESRAEYESLLSGLQETFQPEGTLEEALVKKLAMTLWRHNRLIQAETAEIQSSVEFMEWDQQDAEEQQAEEIGSDGTVAYEGGLIRKTSNPRVLECCLELLRELREAIEQKGFQPEDEAILYRVYGQEDRKHLNENLYDHYKMWLETAGVSDVERLANGYASPEECVRNVLEEINKEIGRLKRYQKTLGTILAQRAKLDAVRRTLPEGPILDRLLRYEAHLERIFDRTLSQLERLQRMRLGQPVLPPIKVHLSD